MTIETDSRPTAETSVEMRQLTRWQSWRGIVRRNGQVLHQTSWTRGFGAKSLALARARTWAELQGYRPNDAT